MCDRNVFRVDHADGFHSSGNGGYRHQHLRQKEHIAALSGVGGPPRVTNLPVLRPPRARVQRQSRLAHVRQRSRTAADAEPVASDTAETAQAVRLADEREDCGGGSGDDVGDREARYEPRNRRRRQPARRGGAGRRRRG